MSTFPVLANYAFMQATRCATNKTTTRHTGFLRYQLKLKRTIGSWNDRSVTKSLARVASHYRIRCDTHPREHRGSRTTHCRSLFWVISCWCSSQLTRVTDVSTPRHRARGRSLGELELSPTLSYYLKIQTMWFSHILDDRTVIGKYK